MKRVLAIGRVIHPPPAEVIVPIDLPWDINSFSVTQVVARHLNNDGDEVLTRFTYLRRA